MGRRAVCDAEIRQKLDRLLFVDLRAEGGPFVMLRSEERPFVDLRCEGSPFVVCGLRSEGGPFAMCCARTDGRPLVTMSPEGRLFVMLHVNHDTDFGSCCDGKKWPGSY